MAVVFNPDYDLPAETRPADDRPSPPKLRIIQGGHAAPSRVAGGGRRRYRRRLLVQVAMVAVVILTILGTAFAFAALESAARPPATGNTGAAAVATGTPVVVVQSGDTLTSIARRIKPTGDTTALVHRLAEIHGPSPLMAGDRISLSNLDLSGAAQN